MTAVTASDLIRYYGDRMVLEGVDLCIGAGEFVALLGRSGTGKTTILRVLAGLDPQFGGDVLVAEKVALVFQEPRLLPWQRVLANVKLGLPGTAENRALAGHALDEVGLAGRAAAWPAGLSGGEAQRVALARALVREPDLLLLDEPFGALDALTPSKMHLLLQELCRRHRPAVLLVSHDVDEAILLADRVLMLGEGFITLEVPVAIDRPRRQGDVALAARRRVLLRGLGADVTGPDGWSALRPGRRRAVRMWLLGLIACQYRAAEWRHQEIELAAHDLLQLLDNTRGLSGPSSR